MRGPALLSRPTVFSEIDFGTANDASIDQDVEVLATRTGVVNSLRLTSPVRIFGSISFRSSDSLMPPVVVPLERDLAVRSGDVVRVRCRYRYGASWHQVHCEAAIVDSRHAPGRPALSPERYAAARPMAASGATCE